MNAAMTLVSVNFRRGRKNPRARPRGNRWEFSPLRLRDNGASSAEQHRHLLIVSQFVPKAVGEKRTAANCIGKWRHPVCVRCSGKQWERPVRVSGSVRWTSVVKVSIIALALPYFSYGKPLPCCVISATSERKGSRSHSAHFPFLRDGVVNTRFNGTSSKRVFASFFSSGSRNRS